ncbi:site-specific integrase [Sphingosinicellaceae bacterium]|nr:site-specific integrase [Sphingosinicellaceae bacterium]
MRPSYGGKREIVRALKTADPSSARQLHALEWVKLDREFTIKRLALGTAAGPEASEPRTPRSPQVAARLKAAWEDYEREQIEQPSDSDEEDPLAQRVAEGIEWRLAVLAEERAEAKRLAKAERNAAVVGLLLPAIVDKWAGEIKPSLKIIETTGKTVEDFYAVVGVLPVTAVTKQHVIAFKDDMVAKQQHPATANGRLNRLRIVLRYAVANAMIPHDPSAGIRLASKRLAKDARTSYDAKALAAVFGSPVYKDGARPEGGKGEAAYWLPILGLYTGARLNELGQLRPVDVVEESYVGDNDTEQMAWVIRLVSDSAAGLRLKTLSSERRIPVHSELVRLGFLKFAADARANGQARLFPGLKGDRFDTITANWSKWYGGYLRKVCLVTDKRIVFHSFRHTFKENARYSQLAPDVQNEITGHDTGNVADDYGGLSYPLHPLVEGMAKYKVPRFDPLPLSHYA